MYWKVRNLGPEHFVRQYGVHAALAVSVLMNILLLLTRPNPSAAIVKQEQKRFAEFARQVTQHLLDGSYISYEQSTLALLPTPQGPGELAPNVVAQLKQQELIPRSADEAKAILRDLTDTKRVSALRIDSVTPGEPTPQGLIPVQVKGVAAAHSASGSEEHAFTLNFLMGLTGQPPDQRPIVAQLQVQ